MFWVIGYLGLGLVWASFGWAVVLFSSERRALIKGGLLNALRYAANAALLITFWGVLVPFWFGRGFICAWRASK